MLTIPANTTATILAASGYGDGVYVSITCASGWTKSQGTVPLSADASSSRRFRMHGDERPVHGRVLVSDL